MNTKPVLRGNLALTPKRPASLSIKQKLPKGFGQGQAGKKFDLYSGQSTRMQVASLRKPNANIK